MELSYSHRFIFIHVYKVAGQSIRDALSPYSYVPQRRIDRVPVLRRLGDTRIRTLREHNFGHIKAKELEAALPPEVFGSFFKFAFVRNPWDWQVSVCYYVRGRPTHPDHKFFMSFRDFEDYLDWRIHRKGVELQQEFVLSDSGELLVDFVGHYETLAEDFATVCRRIGIEGSLPHKNPSKHADFRECYTPQAKALVAEAYKDDIELFGYEFDGDKRLRPVLGPAEAERLERHTGERV